MQYFFLKKVLGRASTKNKSIPMVTIFGSCRQDSIYNLYPVTSIRNELTYTHYTKEIIQAIEYCKGLREDLTEIVYFRSSLLSEKKITKKFTEDFNATDLFVIEIASRISYKYKGNYLHHEAVDNSKFHNYLDDTVQIFDQTDQEIEEDLIKIRELIFPKKLLVVTHISTKNIGKRFELINALKKICRNLAIPILDPSQIMSNYKENIAFVPNDKARHYSAFGHRIIENSYKRIINELVSDSTHSIVQVYSNDKEKVSTHSAHGFGDFLMGSVSLRQFAEKLNYIPRVSFNNHPIFRYLCNKTIVDSLDLKNVKYIFDTPELIDFVDQSLVFTNHQPIKIAQNDKSFVIENCLTPRVDFQKKISEIRDQLGLNGAYTVIHIRSLDKEEISKKLLAKLQKLINPVLESEKKYLLLSNNGAILSYLNAPNLIKTGLLRCHSGESHIDNEELRDTLIEFFLMSTSQEIIQFSPYPWGSNFSNIISIIYDIPLCKHRS
ncbi:hypothetical protein G6699_09755 [Polynucleobacter paneuropaeus]|nr:hypothetical protein [Polynucleobacter paneuropaeus]